MEKEKKSRFKPNAAFDKAARAGMPNLPETDPGADIDAQRRKAKERLAKQRARGQTWRDFPY